MKSDTKKPVYLRRQRWEESSIWQKKVLLVEATGELTERCNFNCLHCYINQPARDQRIKQKELTTAEWLDFLREVVELGCLTVRFTGGEPLLREDFAELYTFSRRLGLKVGLSTNGSLITSRLARLWAKIPPLEKIEITLYGLDANSYEKITRVKGSWEAVQQGIAYLKDKRIQEKGPAIGQHGFSPGHGLCAGFKSQAGLARKKPRDCQSSTFSPGIYPADGSRGGALLPDDE